MARITPTTLRRALQKAPPAGSYFVHGSEPILRDEATRALVDAALDPALRDFNLDLLTAQQLDPGALGAACATLPMMADRRVVVVRDVEAWKRKTKAKQGAVAYLEKPSPDTVLVLVQGGDDEPDRDLAAHCTEVDCGPLGGDALDDWVDARLAARAVSMTDDARAHLFRATGSDLGLLASEIEKLAAVAGSEPLGVELVGDLVGVRHGETADDWRDAVLRDDVATAVTVLPRVLDQAGTSGVRMISSLGTALIFVQFARSFMEAKQTREQGPVAQAVRDLIGSTRTPVGSYQSYSRTIAAAAPRWSLRRLAQAITMAAEADAALKNSTISDETGILTDLVLKLAATRQKKAA